tara:strand:- start:3396 stop:5018 length:1623 start_codon:yes stop_codon:yes gene_type:complete
METNTFSTHQINFTNVFGYHVCCMQNLLEKKVKFSVNNKIIIFISKEGKLRVEKNKENYETSPEDYLIFIISINTFPLQKFYNIKKMNLFNKSNVSKYKDTLFFKKNNNDKYALKFLENELDILSNDFENLKKYVEPSKIHKNLYNNVRSNLNFKNDKEKYKFVLIRYIVFRAPVIDKECNYYNLKFNDIYEISWRENKGIDAIILAGDDWANTAHRFTKSYNINNKNVLLIKLNRHPFNYPEQGIVWNVRRSRISEYPLVRKLENINLLTDIMDNISKVILHATQVYYFNNRYIFQLFPKKEYIFCHGGTTYREAPQKIRIFDKYVKKYIIQSPDLLGYSPKNVTEKLIYYPIETKKINPDFSFRNKNKLTIAHWPSNTYVKGTKLILQTISKLYKDSFNFDYIGVINVKEKAGDKRNDKVSWEENIKRMKNIDIYIETVKPILNGKKFGEWGNTCLEAAACGAIVCTNCLEYKKYEKEYNTKLPLLVSNNANDLYNNLKNLLTMDRKDLLDLKKKSRKWCEDYHSIKKTGERLIEYIF